MKLMNPPRLLAAIVLSSAFAGSADAQTLQVDPIYIGGTAAFEVQGGSPDTMAIICYSMNGMGPFTLNNGITLDLSMPIKNLSPFILNSLGNGTLGPFPVPSSAAVGMQVWFQGVQLDMWATPIYSVTNMVPITVQNMPNNPPTAVDDTATATTNTLVTIDVMANDSDIDGDDIGLFSVSTPTNGGSAVINGDVIDYVSAPGFSGTEIFTYQLEDAQGAQDAATVTVTVQNPNSPPIASDDTAVVTNGGTTLIDVLSNDTDPDGDPIVIVSVSSPLNGVASVVSQSIQYTPNNSYVGIDSFSYTIEDTHGNQDSASVDLTVNSIIYSGMTKINNRNYEMGDHYSIGGPDESPIHEVALDGLHVDTFEVTNQQYVDYLNSAYAAGAIDFQMGSIIQVSGYRYNLAHTNSYSQASKITWNGSGFDVILGHERTPVVEISWYGACHYANWLSNSRLLSACYDENTWTCDFGFFGYRLPTEAEWEYMSRGGNHSPYYQYPWGSNSISVVDGNYGANLGAPTDIGSYPPNDFGIYDSGGNVSEWCNDWYDASFYDTSVSDEPSGPLTGTERVIRGGSWDSTELSLRNASRGSLSGLQTYGDVGFRLVLATNNRPVTQNDYYFTKIDTMVVMDPLMNDTDPDGGMLTLSTVSTPLNGQAIIVNNRIEYTPNAGYLGPDFFSYTTVDDFGDDAIGEVQVVIEPTHFDDMVYVAPATFDMGDHAGVGGSEERPVHSVTLDGFYIDKYEMTNSKYVIYLNDSLFQGEITASGVQVGGANAQLYYLGFGAAIIFNGVSFEVLPGLEEKPLGNISYFGAFHYCNWLSNYYGKTPCYDETTWGCNFLADGFRVSTEAEWECASRAGNNSPYFLYPWASDSISPLNANYSSSSAVDVGSYPPNSFGIYDMSGNHNELVNDNYDHWYYASSPSHNPTGPTINSVGKVIRGGVYYRDEDYLRSAWRRHQTLFGSGAINHNLDATSFRCVTND